MSVAAAAPDDNQDKYDDGVRNSKDWVGRTLDGYRLYKQIGKGNTGAVFYATPVKPNTRMFGKCDVAIKIYFNQLPADEQGEHEGQILMGLNHHNIIRPIGYGCTKDGHLYLIYEYFEIGSLDKLIFEKPSFAVRVMQEIYSALVCLAQKGMLYGDLHEGNILIENAENSRIKLIDFEQFKKDSKYNDTLYLLIRLFRRMMWDTPLSERLSHTQSQRLKEICNRYEALSDTGAEDISLNQIDRFVSELHNVIDIKRRTETGEYGMEARLAKQDMPSLSAREPIEAPTPVDYSATPAQRFRLRRPNPRTWGILILPVLLFGLFWSFYPLMNVTALVPPSSGQSVVVYDGRVMQRDWATGEWHALTPNLTAATSKTSTDGLYLAVDHALIDRQTGAMLRDFTRQPIALAVDFSPDSRFFARHDGQTVTIWQLPEMRLLHELSGVSVEQAQTLLQPSGYRTLLSVLKTQPIAPIDLPQP